MSSGEPCYSWNIPLRFLRNEKDRFLEGFYSLCAGSVSRRFLGGVEHRDGIQGVPVGNSVINHALRMMLLFENEEENGLEILRNAPSRWFEPGKVVQVRNAPTYFGAVNYRITSSADMIECAIDPPTRQEVAWVEVYLNLPDGTYIGASNDIWMVKWTNAFSITKGAILRPMLSTIICRFRSVMCKNPSLSRRAMSPQRSQHSSLRRPAVSLRWRQ